MRRTIVFIISLMTCSALSINAQSRVSLASPDGKLKIRVSTTGGRASIAIDYGEETLISDSRIGFEFEDGTFGDDVRMKTLRKSKRILDDYRLPVGKTSHVRSESNEMAVMLTERSGRKVELILRAFNDGVAYRYIIPEQDGMEGLAIRNEILEVKAEGDPSANVLFMPEFHNSHEGVYTTAALSRLDNDRLIDMPALLNYGDRRYVAIMEANLVDYAGMYLVNRNGVLTGRLSPRLDKPWLSVVGDLPHRTPWRVFLVSDRAGALIESNILTSLADPCPEQDLSWLKPGKTTFSWWCDFQIPDTTWQRGNNFLSNKYYIDFAADNGIEYHSVYGYADMPWYIDDGPGFGLAGPGADLTRHDPRLDFPAVCRYAASRGVDMHVWLNWAALYKDIDRVFDKFNEWGVKGMMVDFMDRDDQEMIQIQETILKKAMDHHLFIQFHGASKPSGLVRTYPNEFTREGTLNYENFKWLTNGAMTAEHDLCMPFTRNLAGPADYHLGGFRAVPYKDFHPVYTRPTVSCTRAHMLAMYVVLDSYLNMVADAPEAYRGQPGFEFIKAVPTVWDETKVPSGKPDDHVVVARRHGEDWYAGAIGTSQEKEISFSLDFLGDGEYELTLFSDAPDTDTNPNSIDKRVVKASAADSISIRIAGNGGSAMIFKKL